MMSLYSFPSRSVGTRLSQLRLAPNRPCMTLVIIQRKYFLDGHFSYNNGPCPYLEGTKDALYYKFRRLITGQNCSAICTNEGAHTDTYSNE